MKREEKNKYAETITSDSDEYHPNQLSVTVKRGRDAWTEEWGREWRGKETIVSGREKNAGELMAVDSGKCKCADTSKVGVTKS